MEITPSFGGTAKTVQLTSGDLNAKIIFLSGVPDYDGSPIPDNEKSLILNTMRNAKLDALNARFDCVLGEIPPGRKHFLLSTDKTEGYKQACRDRLALTDARVIVPLDDIALSTICGFSNIGKWQCSILEAALLPNKRKTIPLYSPAHVFKNYRDIAFLIHGIHRVGRESEFKEIKRIEREFHINPTFEQAMAWLFKCVNEEFCSIDIETRQGQVTHCAFSFNPLSAMSIPLLPENWTTEQFHLLWSAINDVFRGPSLKVFQNLIYDCTYFSRYGIQTLNVWMDTMLAQKFLHPELPMGLDSIARLHTEEPYWKDEGKDWENVANPDEFSRYNCKDAALTLEAAFELKADLTRRGLYEAFHRLIMSLVPAATEMCWRGLPVNMGKRDELRQSLDAELALLNANLSETVKPVLPEIERFNSRSHVQVKDYIRAKKYYMPIKKGKETSNTTALLKLIQSHPEDKVLPLLITLSEKNTAVSRYLKPLPYPDGRMRYRLGVGTTDTTRWTSGLDAWDNGFNAQTIPGDFKVMFEAPPGMEFVEVDLKQADARVVAWEGPVPGLMKFFNEGRDIHKFVGSRLFNKPESEVTPDERQLGKKTGHAANYGVMGQTMSDSCLLEMGLVLPVRQATQMLNGYHQLFPEVNAGYHLGIQQKLRTTKKLTSPLGSQRYFYDRIGPDLFRAAYAWLPQNIVVNTINCLIKHVHKHRDPVKVHHILQIHDSALFLVYSDYIPTLLDMIKAESDWNPIIPLKGGNLQIPIEVKQGVIWKDARKIYG